MSSSFGSPKVKKHHRPANPESVDHVKHRETARIFVQNSLGDLLLLNTHWDPGTGLPPRWLTPGGGVDVYRVTDEGLSYYTTHYPFPADGDQAMGYAG